MFRYSIKGLSVAILIFTVSMSLLADKTTSFQEIIDENNMVFTMPKDFTPVTVVENEDVMYQYALKSDKVKLEIRYSIFSLKEELIKYEEWKKSKKGIMADSNESYYSMTLCVVVNIAGSELYKEIKLDQARVKSEFNADWGMSYIVECKSGYGKGYKYAMIFAMHRNNCADAYTVFLLDDLKVAVMEIQKAFYSMKYK